MRKTLFGIAATVFALTVAPSREAADASPAAARRRDLIAEAIDASRAVDELIRKGDSQLWAEFVLKPVNRANLFTSVTKRAVLYQSSRFEDHAILVIYRLNKDRRYEVRAIQREDHPDRYFGAGKPYER